MHRAVVCINDIVPDAIGFTTASGMPGDIRIDFKTIAGIPYPHVDDLNPQLVLRPFTTTAIYGYDINIDDITGASGLATIPGSVMNDRFNVEVYTRNDYGQPQAMIAMGRIDLTGYGYKSSSPLSPAVATVGPMGPMGPQGPTGAQGPMGTPGTRGSMWFSGSGLPPSPFPTTLVDGDMWLNNDTGDLYRWDANAGTWMRA